MPQYKGTNMTKKLVITIMLGMNRFTGRDSFREFDMDFFDRYNKIWMPQIDNDEKKCSTPIYEVTKTIDEFITSHNNNCPEKPQIIKEDVYFIIGRGTFGNDSEERLSEILLQARHTFGEDAFYMIYAKSYGVIDTLKSFLQVDMKNFKINLMFAIDGFSPPISRRSVTKRYKIGDKKQTRLIIPKGIKKVYSIVQRKKGFNGIMAGRPRDGRCRNKIIHQKEVDVVQKYYDHYKDGYKRKLDVDHYNMEEIVSTIPCCQVGINEYTVNDIIKMCCRKYVG